MVKVYEQLEKLHSGLKDYAATIVNIVIILLTTGIEQLTSAAVYRCPCVELSQLDPGCKPNRTDTECVQRLNLGYGVAFIFAPAFSLFIFSAAANPRLWKLITGYWYKNSRKGKKQQNGKVQNQQNLTKNENDEQGRKIRHIIVTYLRILVKSLLSPLTWICIALIEGRYLACAITILPYRIGGDSGFENCEKVKGTVHKGRPHLNLKKLTPSPLSKKCPH